MNKEIAKIAMRNMKQVSDNKEGNILYKTHTTVTKQHNKIYHIIIIFISIIIKHFSNNFHSPYGSRPRRPVPRGSRTSSAHPIGQRLHSFGLRSIRPTPQSTHRIRMRISW